MAKRNLIRFAFGLMYIVGSIVNFSFVITNPEIYRSWADSALLPFYKEIMLRLSPEQLIVILFIVAVYEFTTGVLICGKGVVVRVGLTMAALFHIIITPWGYWSLPNLLLLLVPLYLIGKDFESSLVQNAFSKVGKE